MQRDNLFRTTKIICTISHRAPESVGIPSWTSLFWLDLNISVHGCVQQCAEPLRQWYGALELYLLTCLRTLHIPQVGYSALEGGGEDDEGDEPSLNVGYLSRQSCPADQLTNWPWPVQFLSQLTANPTPFYQGCNMSFCRSSDLQYRQSVQHTRLEYCGQTLRHPVTGVSLYSKIVSQHCILWESSRQPRSLFQLLKPVIFSTLHLAVTICI